MCVRNSVGVIQIDPGTPLILKHSLIDVRFLNIITTSSRIISAATLLCLAYVLKPSTKAEVNGGHARGEGLVE